MTTEEQARLLAQARLTIAAAREDSMAPPRVRNPDGRERQVNRPFKNYRNMKSGDTVIITNGKHRNKVGTIVEFCAQANNWHPRVHIELADGDRIDLATCSIQKFAPVAVGDDEFQNARKALEALVQSAV